MITSAGGAAGVVIAPCQVGGFCRSNREGFHRLNGMRRLACEDWPTRSISPRRRSGQRSLALPSMKILTLCLVAILGSVALAGCGGGGGGGAGSEAAGAGGLGANHQPGGTPFDPQSDPPVTGDPARSWRGSTADPSQAVWSGVMPLSLVPSGAANLPDGRILFWSAEQRLSFNDPGRTYTTVFNPANGRAEERLVAETSHDMFCPGTTNLPDGRLLVTGGIDSGTVSLYDPTDRSWTRGPSMNIPRGYHSNVLTADGHVLALGGSWSGGIGGKNGELYVPGAGWRLLPGLPIQPMVGPDPGGMYRADNHLWLFTTADHRLFHAGPSVNMHWITTGGGGGVVAAGGRGDDVYSQNGSAALYTIGRVLKTGGAPAYENASATANSYTIGIGADATVRKLAPMAYPRAFHNSVVLPNGQVVIVGGQRYAVPFTDDQSVLVPELWDPGTRTFTPMPPMTVPRNYHGVALLMADGRVAVSGGGLCGTCATNHPDVQILTPPYLLEPGGGHAPRPAITASPAQAALGSTISVATDQPIATFVLMRLSSTTHTVNNDQRRVPLSHVANGATHHSVSIPSNPGVVLPGDYMLFALDVAGVPSVSRLIRITANGVPRITNPGTIWSAPQMPVDLSLAASGGETSWSATGLPPGLSIDAGGRVTGAATKRGSFRVTVTARSASGAASTDFQWNVTMWPAARFVRFEALSEASGGQWTSAAELEVLDPSGQPLPTTGWSATADSSEPQNPPALAIDGATGSLWHSRYGGGIAPLPHALTIDMKTSRTIGGFRYWPRQDGQSNGTVAAYRFSVSHDGHDWQPVAEGDFARWQTGAAAKSVFLQNVAAFRPAVQSSGDPAAAARAVDGNVSGNAAAGTVSSTASQSAPWWQVDLGAVHSLQGIRLWNRTDCCAERLADITVFVSRNDMSGRSMAALAADPEVWRYQIVGAAARETLIRGSAGGRYVRVQAAGTNPLSLAEVEAFGVADEAGTPALEDPDDVIGERGKAAVLALRAGDQGGGLAYAATNLPDGLRLESATGRIGGTPTRAGAWVVSVSARNAAGRAVESTFTWIVVEPAPATTTATDIRPAAVLGDGGLTGTAAGTADAAIAVTTKASPGASDAGPGPQSAAAGRGAALFAGERPLAGRIAGHERALPTAVTRCANCHEAPASASSTVASGVVLAGATRPAAGDGRASFGPTLDARSLTVARSRRGGPSSRYAEASFCSLLRTGIDPASVVLSHQMPRYDIGDGDCADLWAWLQERR